MDSVCDIFDYLKNGLVVNVFYLRDRDAIKQQLIDYLTIGTKSLRRKYLTQKREVNICEYRVYKVLTFFDCIRASNYYGVFVSIYNFVLIDYLLDYVLSGCTIDCTECKDFDFFTHYAKNNLLNDVVRVEHRLLDQYRIVKKQEFPERRPREIYFEKCNDSIYSMMLLNFDLMYRVVSLRRIASRYGYSYVITLFGQVEYLDHIDQTMISDFWLPKSCLSEIRGNKNVQKLNGDLDIWENQFIRVVDTKTYRGNKYVVIKSFTVKSIPQLRKNVSTT